MDERTLAMYENLGFDMEAERYRGGDCDRQAAYETASRGRAWIEYCDYMNSRNLCPITGRKVER